MSNSGNGGNVKRSFATLFAKSRASPGAAEMLERSRADAGITTDPVGAPEGVSRRPHPVAGAAALAAALKGSVSREPTDPSVTGSGAGGAGETGAAGSSTPGSKPSGSSSRTGLPASPPPVPGAHSEGAAGSSGATAPSSHGATLAAAIGLGRRGLKPTGKAAAENSGSTAASGAAAAVAALGASGSARSAAPAAASGLPSLPTGLPLLPGGFSYVPKEDLIKALTDLHDLFANPVKSDGSPIISPSGPSAAGSTRRRKNKSFRRSSMLRNTRKSRK